MKLLHLSMLSLIFTASFALSLTKKPTTYYQAAGPQSIDMSPLPILGDTSAVPIFSAQGIIAVDLTSGVTLYEKDPDTPLLPASTTKIVTALVALDHYDLDQIITIDDFYVEGQKMGLQYNEQISIRNLLYGLLVSSGNDAAEVLARNFPEGREEFINNMNQLAKDLNLENTNFENPSGLESPNHVSTARDLIRVSEYAMKNPTFANIVKTKDILVESEDKKFAHRLVNINELVGTVEGVLGVKTGWTENARENLVTYVTRNNRPVLIALLGSQDRFGETTDLIEWIYSNYTWEQVDYSGVTGDTAGT